MMTDRHLVLALPALPDGRGWHEQAAFLYGTV